MAVKWNLRFTVTKKFPLIFGYVVIDLLPETGDRVLPCFKSAP